MKIGKYMTSALKTGLKKLILAKKWSNLETLGPHRSKTACGATNFFLRSSTYLVEQSQQWFLWSKTTLRGSKRPKTVKKRVFPYFPLYFIWEMPAI